MPAPATSLAFATDANFASGPDSGTPTKVLASSGVRAQGWIPGAELPAQHLNAMMGLAGDWQAWLESERARLAGYIGGSSGSSEWVYDAPRSRVRMIDAAAGYKGGISGANWTLDTEGLISDADSARLRVSLNDHLPHGAVLTRIRVFVKPGAARAGANKMGIKLLERMTFNMAGPSYSTTSITMASTKDDDGTSNIQLLDTGTIAETIDSSKILFMDIVAGNTASVAQDVIRGIELSYTDPGPRNY